MRYYWLCILALSLAGCAVASNNMQVNKVKGVSYITVPSVFSKEREANWIELNNYLVHSEDKNITLNWSGIGGYVYIGKETLEALQKAKQEGKKVKLRTFGDVSSMHAYITCYVDTEFTSGTELMFHMQGKERYGINYRDNTYRGIKSTKELLQPCVDKGIITDQDVNAMLFDYKTIWYLYTPEGRVKRYSRDNRPDWESKE